MGTGHSVSKTMSKAINNEVILRGQFSIRSLVKNDGPSGPGFASSSLRIFDMQCHEDMHAANQKLVSQVALDVKTGDKPRVRQCIGFAESRKVRNQLTSSPSQASLACDRAQCSSAMKGMASRRAPDEQGQREDKRI